MTQYSTSQRSYIKKNLYNILYTIKKSPADCRTSGFVLLSLMTIYCDGEVTGSFRCTLLFFPDCRVFCIRCKKFDNVRHDGQLFRSLVHIYIYMCVCVCVCFLFFIFCRFRRTLLTVRDFGRWICVCMLSTRRG